MSSAAAAQQAGVIGRAVAASELRSAANEMAQESYSLGLSVSTKDHGAGLEAFLAKQQPQFVGR